MKLLKIGLISLFLISSAAAFETELVTSDPVANETKQAQYEIEINNTAEEERSYQITSQGHRGVTLFDSSKTIPPGETGIINLIARPETNQREGNYRFEVFITERQTDRMQTIEPRVEVKREQTLDFYSVDYNDTVRPSEKLQTEVEVINLGSTTKEDYQITFDFLEQTSTQTGLSINPEAQRNYQKGFEIPERHPPIEETLEIKITQPDGTNNTFTTPIQVEEHPNIERIDQTENRIITKTQQIFLNNTGNTETKQTIQIETRSYLTPITTFSETPDNQYEEDGNTISEWNLQVNPDETQTITAQTRYWIPITILALILALVIGIKELRSDIKITRKPEYKDGKVQITINIENNSNKTFNDVKVKEYISNIAEVEKNFEMAKPVITKKKEGTQLKWQIKELEPGDQLIYKYTIKPLVEVEEGVTLEPTKVIDSKDQIIQKAKEINLDF